MAQSYISYLAIEKKPALKGIPLADLLIAVLLFVIMLLVGAFLLILGAYTPYWFGFSVTAFIAGLVVLKSRSRKGQPAFFLSYFSFLILQPRKLKPEYGKINFSVPGSVSR